MLNINPRECKIGYMEDFNRHDQPALDLKTQAFGRELEGSVFVLDKTMQLLRANLRTLKERLDQTLNELDANGFTANLTQLSEVQAAAATLEQLRRSFEAQRNYADSVRSYLRQIVRQG
jgi:hypothetical protein